MAMEIKLINQIEKHEFLYNFNMPEYNRKDMVEEAWANIAANTSMSISDCKEKWRNIRSSFLRSMKPSGLKVKKPYYLTEYLKFILPYLKPINAMENAEDNQYESQQNNISVNEAEIAVDFIKEEPLEIDNEENNENHAGNAILSDLLTRSSPVVRKRRRYIPMKKNYTELRTRGKVVPTTYQRNSHSSEYPNAVNSNSAIKMYLLSLLPELESMTDDQIRLFKIKTMLLIDDIKVNYAEVRQSTTPLNNERLQKRLINLLLKNLQRATKNSETKTKEGKVNSNIPT